MVFAKTTFSFHWTKSGSGQVLQEENVRIIAGTLTAGFFGHKIKSSEQ